MPTELATEAMWLLKYLLPGFLCSAIFYNLTSHTRPSQFERVVQAMIFTFLIQALLVPFKGLLIIVGQSVSIGVWSSDSEVIATIILALLVGVVVAFYANNDGVHGWLRRRGFTTRTSFPTEWFGVFSQKITYVILHLHDGRRLYGWPKEWPTDSAKGHFYIMQPSWILLDGKTLDLDQLDGVLISTRDVKWVEFIAKTGEKAP